MRRRKTFEVLKNKEAKKRYGVYYYKLVDTDEFAVRQDTSGSTDTLAQAYRLAAGHCAASELLHDEYAKALVIDRWQGQLLRVYTKRTNAIMIRDV